MRLIDADKIEINEEYTFSGKGIKAFLDSIPTAHDVDKVVERLNEYEAQAYLEGWKRNFEEMIEIVKSGGIE